MTLAKKDFIEIEFTGKIKDNGDIFDSNIKEDLAKTDLKTEPKPFVFAIGEGMFVKGVDDFLIGKELGEHLIEVKPEDGFGKRDPKLIQMIPSKVFVQHKMHAYPGAMFNFDGKVAKVLTVSGGRIMVDFNNPLSGKDLEYKIKILRKVEDINEQIKSLNDFLFRQEFEFEVKDKKLIMKIPKGMKPFIEMFKQKYKDIFDLDIETIEVEGKVEKTENKK